MNGAVGLAGAVRTGGGRHGAEPVGTTSKEEKEAETSFAALLDGETEPKPAKPDRPAPKAEGAPAQNQAGNGAAERAVPLTGAVPLTAVTAAPARQEPAKGETVTAPPAPTPASRPVTAPAVGARTTTAATEVGLTTEADPVTDTEPATEPTGKSAADEVATGPDAKEAAPTPTAGTAPQVQVATPVQAVKADRGASGPEKAAAETSTPAPAKAVSSGPARPDAAPATPTSVHASAGTTAPTSSSAHVPTSSSALVPTSSSALVPTSSSALVPTAAVTSVRAPSGPGPAVKTEAAETPAPSAFVLTNTGLTAALSRPQKVGDGAYQVRAALDPPALGPVDATVKVEGTTVQVNLVAHTAAGHQELAGHLDDLRQTLSQQAGGKVEVTLTSGGDRESGRSDGSPTGTASPSAPAEDDPDAVVVAVPIPSGSSSLHVIL